MCAKYPQTGTEGDGDATSERSYQRRSLLKSALGLGAASAVAGCTSGGNGGDDQTTRASTTEQGTTSEATGAPQNLPRQQAPVDDGVTIVTPGDDIQAALEDAANGQTYARSPWGTVRLQSGKTYEVSETIEMPLYSVLDFNGARMEPTENVDVIDASAGSHLIRPYIDAGDLRDWDSSIIRVSTRIKKVESIDPVYIDRMYIRTPEKQGTGVNIVDENGVGLWSVHMTGTIQQADVGIHLHPEGEDSWVNSCFFDGVMRSNRTAVLMTGTSRWAPAAHNFDVTFQPSETEWFWDLQAGRSNTIRANLWDSQYVEDGTVWRIGEDAELNNVLIDNMGAYRWDDNVVENKFDGPNGASGNALFNWAEAQNHMSLHNTVEDLQEEVADLREQVNGN